MNILAKFGLMKRSEHQRVVAENDDQAYNAWSQMANERDDMSASRSELMHTIAKMQVENKRLATGWDKCGDKLNEANAKFKLAATDLAAQAEEIADLRARHITALAHTVRQRDEALAEVERLKKINADHCRSVNTLNAESARQATEITSLRHDAQKWRDKLARDRAARKGVGK